MPLTGPKVMPQVEEMVATLESALSQVKNGAAKPGTNGTNGKPPAATGNRPQPARRT